MKVLRIDKLHSLLYRWRVADTHIVGLCVAVKKTNNGTNQSIETNLPWLATQIDLHLHWADFSSRSKPKTNYSILTKSSNYGKPKIYAQCTQYDTLGYCPHRRLFRHFGTLYPRRYTVEVQLRNVISWLYFTGHWYGEPRGVILISSVYQKIPKKISKQ